VERATVHEELAAIRSLMADSQSFLYGTWPHQLTWGAVGITGVVATWVALGAEAYGATVWIWGVLVCVGWAFSFALMRRGPGGAPVRNVASRAYGGIWIALGITLTILGTLTVGVGAVDPLGLPGLIAVVFGAGYFASGWLAGLRWLTAVGVCWWVAGVGLLVWSDPRGLLALAALTLLLEVGPALALRRMERAADTGTR
jgi:hypothetical protein